MATIDTNEHSAIFVPIRLNFVKTQWQAALLTVICMLLVLPQWTCCHNITITLGALYAGKSNPSLPNAFRLGIMYMQQNPDFLPETIDWRLIIENTNNDAAVAVSGAEKLVSEGVVGIIGPTFSFESVEASQVATRAHVPMLSYASTSSVLSDKSLVCCYCRFGLAEIMFTILTTTTTYIHCFNNINICSLF